MLKGLSVNTKSFIGIFWYITSNFYIKIPLKLIFYTSLTAFPKNYLTNYNSVSLYFFNKVI